LIPFPLFEPDKSPFNAGAGNNLLNCLPVADGWGPMPSLSAITSALGAECKGAVFVRTAAGAYSVIAGTEAGLFKLNTADYTWTDISGASAPYSVPENDLWSFTVFGTKLIAHTLGDVPQVYDIEAGSTFADLGGSPPTAKYSWVAGDFLVFGYLDGEPNTIQWSGLNNAAYWTIGERGSDKQELPAGGEIMGGIPDQRGALIIQRNAMQYMQFAPGSGYTFTIAPANEKRGTIAPHSIAQIGPGQFLYLSEDGFFSGVAGQPIGAERVDRWFFENVDQAFLGDVKGVADPYQKIVWWQFVKPDSTKLLLGYDWQLDRWCYSDQDVSQMVALSTPATTWDGLDALYANIDAVDVPFDSRLFAGGRPTFAAFTTDNKLAYFTGANKAATLETADIELVPGYRAWVNGGRVQTDCIGFTVEIAKADFHGGTFTYKSAVSPSTRSGHLPFRASGRLHRFRMNVTAGEDWSHVSGINAMYVAEGMQ
jgi:hypothetical protein